MKPAWDPGEQITVDFFTFFLGEIFAGWTEWNPLEGVQGNWVLLREMNYFLPITEMAALMIVMLAVGLPLLLVTVGIWFSVGIVRGGSPRA